LDGRKIDRPRWLARNLTISQIRYVAEKELGENNVVSTNGVVVCFDKKTKRFVVFFRIGGKIYFRRLSLTDLFWFVRAEE